MSGMQFARDYITVHLLVDDILNLNYITGIFNHYTTKSHHSTDHMLFIHMRLTNSGYVQTIPDPLTDRILDICVKTHPVWIHPSARIRYCVLCELLTSRHAQIEPAM